MVNKYEEWTTVKTVLITGTSSGIGLATAVAAAQAGWRAVATMRDTSKADALLKAAEAAGVRDRVEVRVLDVTDPISVETCLAQVVADHGVWTRWSTTPGPAISGRSRRRRSRTSAP